MADENDYQTDTEEIVGEEGTEIPSDRILELEKMVAQKDEQIRNLSSRTRELKKQVKDKAPEGLDYGQKAFLKTSGIDNSEFEFVEEQLKESNMPLDKLLSNSYFQAQLKEKREIKAIESAMPQGDARQNGSVNPKSQVDWWINRGELPPNSPENQELRREIVNRRYDLEKNRSKFSSQGVIEGGVRESTS